MLVGVGVRSSLIFIAGNISWTEVTVKVSGLSGGSGECM